MHIVLVDRKYLIHTIRPPSINQKARIGRKDMGKKIPPMSEEELQRKHARFFLVVASISNVIRVAILAFAAWGIVHSAIYLPVLASSGKETLLTVSMHWFADLKLDVIAGWATGAAGVAYGETMRRKLKKERTEKDARISELEKAIDPQRSSSGLDPSGKPIKKGGTK
jgi:hypothetical protein